MSEYEKAVEALEQAKKEHELFELYRLLVEIEEEYNTNDNILEKQKLLDDLRNVREEINQLEEELHIITPLMSS